MKNARNQFILLGFVCQAFSWDDYLLPLLSSVLWVLCLTVPRKPVRLGQIGEFALMVVGMAAGYWASVWTGRTAHFFVGYGLALVQAARLMRPLSRREKLFSVLIAFLQVGVACTIVLDFRFVVILVAALVLIPRVLLDLETEPGNTAASASIQGKTISFPAWSYVLIFAGAALFYVLFPRGFAAEFPEARFVGPDFGTLSDSVLDPTRGSVGQSAAVLLQIEGEQMGYLRCFAMTRFDGQKWNAEPDYLQPLPPVSSDRLDAAKHRRVRVKNVHLLSKTLPVDGEVARIEGKFFRKPRQNGHGLIRCDVMWNTANNLYEYWLANERHYEPLTTAQLRKYTEYPPQSDRLQAWVDRVVAGAGTPLEQARKLENCLKKNFRYTLGAPQLSRVNPVDDFIFNQKEGHCERFAAHLALLLRMKGIPSRVVVGYLPSARSWFSGCCTIRFRDAHAWTEAWFEGIGWRLFDATPAATMDRSGSYFREALDSLDFAWYSNVVAFDAPAQTRLLNASVQQFAAVAGWLHRNKPVLFIPVGVLFVWIGARLVKRFSWHQRPARRTAEIATSHCYGKMLHVLAKKGIHRESHLTPFEFLKVVDGKAPVCSEHARVITGVFCDVRYGTKMSSPSAVIAMERALWNIKRIRLTPNSAPIVDSQH